MCMFYNMYNSVGYRQIMILPSWLITKTADQLLIRNIPIEESIHEHL